MKENKLIAEFMGYEIHTPNGKAFSFKIPNMPTKFTPIENLKYHKSWDWLMPVVEKIEYCDGISNDDVITIEYKDCIIPHHQGEVRIEGANSKLDAVYQAVVEFINQYNKENESND